MKQNIKIDVEDNKLKELIIEVIQRIPKKLPSISIYNFKGNCKGICGEVDVYNNIGLNNYILFNKRKDYVIGVIAHELAHTYLKHGYLEQGGLLKEMDADLLACKWGFKKEIKKFRIKYIKSHRKKLQKLHKKTLPSSLFSFHSKKEDEWLKIIE